MKAHRKSPRGQLSAALLTGLVTFSACTAAKRVVPIDKTFLEDVDTSQQVKGLPFDHSWVKRSEANKENYNGVFFRPVRTDLLPSGAWVNSGSAWITSQEDYDAAAKEIAQYFTGRLRDEIKYAEKPWIGLEDEPGPGTLVVEIALTELEFSHPVGRAAALAAPVPGTGAAMSAITDPHVAFAARIYDGTTGELLATVGDRKFPPLRIVDLNKLTVKSSPREICALWAKSIADSFNRKGFTEVEEKRFTLVPW